MLTLKKQLMHGFASFALILAPFSSAVAEDIEIFFGQPTGTFLKPNILFIMDNSGSMSSTVRTYNSYDQTKTYSGPYDQNRVYYTRTGRGSIMGSFLISESRCDDMISGLNSAAGAYLAQRVARYSSSNKQWSYLGGTHYSDVIECEMDRGIHGEDPSSSKVYAKNGNRSILWSNNVNDEINWSNIYKRDLYSANYLNWHANHRTYTEESRISIVKRVAKNLADSLSGVNIGLMSFNKTPSNREGGRVQVAIDDVASNRTSFKTEVDSLNPDTWTPLSETLFEAYRYISAGNLFLAQKNQTDAKALASANQYESPISNMCQPTNIVLLTDGAPTYDSDPTISNYNDDDASNRSVITSEIGSCSGNCLDEIAGHMHDKDMSPLAGTQNVTTYTIGFNIDHPLLKEAAEAGGGQYYIANDSDELQTVLTNIAAKVLSVNSSFVSPGVAVNSFNRLKHRDALLYSVFNPQKEPLWPGNLKRYRLGEDAIIYDANDKNAVDDENGFFKDSAKSFWSTQVDGPDVTLGGIRSKLPSNNTLRKVYTYRTGSADRQLSSHEINTTNISKAMLGNPAMTNSDHQLLVNWLRGMDSKDIDGDGDINEPSNHISDPLHSIPKLVIYGGSDASPDMTAFIGDNQGFIHAVDAETGEMRFSFIPQELLLNQALLYDNDQSTPHIYGMDGQLTTWAHAENEDTDYYDSGEFVHLYAGMRRGGRSYYALDVSDVRAPKFLWSITGGITNGFEELGETWSKMIKTKIRINKSDRDVLIFTGGYDSNQDINTERSFDSVGRAIYIVDATDGTLIWSGGPNSTGFTKSFSRMQYSIPSTPRVADVDGDDLADQIYVGDMGGQIWRFDIDNSTTRADNLITGAVIADLGGSSASNSRRFYHEPDLFGVKIGNTRHLGLLIGSGWQAHPLNREINDRLYFIKIKDAFAPPIDANSDGTPDYYKLTESDLYDTTENLIETASTAEARLLAQTAMDAAEGWFIRFERTGEKMLSTPITINGESYYTTYEPNPSTSSCLPSAGTSRLFHIFSKSGSPVYNYDGIEHINELGEKYLTKEDREVKEILTGSLPSDPQIVNNSLCVNTECSLLPGLDKVKRTYWYEN